MLYRAYGLLKNSPPLRGTVVFSALISCYIALTNGYPLLYPDTGTYIASAFESIVPPDRPVFYGLFIYLFSSFHTLFPVVYMQALLVCFLLDITLRMFYPGALGSILTLFTVTVLTLFTSYSFIVSILIPDIFTPMVFLCLFNLLLNRNLRVWELVSTCVILVFALCTQFSSLYVTLVCLLILLAVMGILKLRRKDTPVVSMRFFLVCGSAALPFLAVPLANYGKTGEFKIQNAGPVFFVSHSNEIGLLQTFLQEECGAGAGYKLCAYRDSSVWDFIWQPNSPFARLGGWNNNQAEYRQIMWEMLSREKYLFPIIQKGIEGTLRQLFLFDVPAIVPQRVGSAPFSHLQARYPTTLRDYHNSAQFHGGPDVSAFNVHQRVLLLFSVTLIFVVCVCEPLRRRIPLELRYGLIFFFVFMVVQAALSANLSTIDCRYQSRVAWLLPVMASLCLPSIIRKTNGR